MSRRTLLVAALAVVALTAGAIAVQAERARAAPTPHDAAAPLVTPVLSARRAPELVAAPVADRRMTAHLQDLLSNAPATSCLTVAVDGRTIFASNPTMPLTPASVEKLATAEAALSDLGPSSVFTTTVEAAEPPEGGVVDGDLWLVGGGDPVLMTDDYAARYKHQPVLHTRVESLVDEIVAAGVHEIRGAVVGDESRYDRLRYLPQWPARFATEAEVGPLSALMVNDGLTQYPPAYDVHAPKETPADDPAAAAADDLASLLQARGVTVAAPARSGNAPDGATAIASIQSPPLDQIVAAMTTESDNDTAELLTKELGLHHGGAGTTADGVAAIRATLQERGLPMDGTVQVDGSGLASETKETCALVQSLLDAEGPGSTLAAGLPVAGQTGTLDVRFLGSPVVGRLRAKTGTLNQSTALAGYLKTARGANLSFAFIMNVAPPERITDDDVALEDELGTVLDQYPETPDVSTLGPKPG